MDRLEFIAINDPEWAVMISEFLDKFPEFSKYRAIAPATRRAIPQNEEWIPKTLFETVIYYACASAVRYEYAVEQYKVIIIFLRSSDWITLNSQFYNFLMSSTITNKKKTLYWDIFHWMCQKGITNKTLTVKQALAMKDDIKGLGDGYYSFIKGNFSEDDDCIEYTDINFRKGFMKVYGTDNLTIIKNKVKEYVELGFGRIANGYMFQIYRYS